MGKRNYTHVQELLPEIEAMLGLGKTQREVAEYFGFRDKYVVKSLVKRERAKQRKREAGITIRPKGRPRKAASPRDIVAEQAYEIQRLRAMVGQRRANHGKPGFFGKLPLRMKKFFHTFSCPSRGCSLRQLRIISPRPR